MNSHKSCRLQCLLQPWSLYLGSVLFIVFKSFLFPILKEKNSICDVSTSSGKAAGKVILLFAEGMFHTACCVIMYTNLTQLINRKLVASYFDN